MKKRKGEDRIVYQSLAMGTQFGLNMIRPICLLSAAGVCLDGKFGTSYLTILLFVIGAVAGGQNVYRMAKRLYGGREEDKEQGDVNEDNRDTEEDE